MSRSYVDSWKLCADYIRSNLGQEKFDIWFADVEAVSYADKCLTLSVRNQFFKDQYESSFASILRSALNRYFEPGTQVEYQIDIISDDPLSQVRMLSPQSSPILTNKTAQSATITTGGSNVSNFDPQLNPTYNFENYCEGRSNKVPLAIARFIVDNPGRTDFNPFFLHGSVGVGKTHLIQAIGIGLKERYPSARVLYVTMRHFINLLGRAKIEGDISNFVNFYNSLDVLLLDDIQELQGKTGTMNHLFPIFNYLHQSGKKLIFTSDRKPDDLDGVTDRLIDRFKWGIIEELPKPDHSLRRRILTLKARKNGLALPEEVIDLLAEQEGVTVRELEGMVMGLISRSITLNIPISLELTKTVIKNSVKTPKRKQINFDMIVESTAEHFNLNPDAIFSKCRQRDISDARQAIMFLASKMLGLSSPAIGHHLGRAHATVLHDIKAVKDRISVSNEFSALIEAIEADIRK